MLRKIKKALKEARDVSVIRKVKWGKKKNNVLNPIVSLGRDTSAEMNAYFQHDYPYPKNIGAFF